MAHSKTQLKRLVTTIILGVILYLYFRTFFPGILIGFLLAKALED